MDVLAKEEIPFMHWGIINKFNYTEGKVIPYREMDSILKRSSSAVYNYY